MWQQRGLSVAAQVPGSLVATAAGLGAMGKLGLCCFLSNRAITECSLDLAQEGVHRLLNCGLE
jgi:hypothetical protein